MKRNASRSDVPKMDGLTLVDEAGQQIASGDQTLAADRTPSAPEGLSSRLIVDRIGQMHHWQIVAFATVSITCAAAAAATGSYALWLSRRKVVRETLVSVNELLETCRERVSRMEEELNSSMGRS